MVANPSPVPASPRQGPLPVLHRRAVGVGLLLATLTVAAHGGVCACDFMNFPTGQGGTTVAPGGFFLTGAGMFKIMLDGNNSAGDYPLSAAGVKDLYLRYDPSVPCQQQG